MNMILGFKGVGFEAIGKWGLDKLVLQIRYPAFYPAGGDESTAHVTPSTLWIPWFVTSWSLLFEVVQTC